MVKLLFKQKKQPDKAMKKFEDFLVYIRSGAISGNYVEKAVSAVLDFIQGLDKMDLVQQVYDKCLGALRDAKNEKVWFRTYIKEAKFLFGKEEYAKMGKVLQSLHKACQLEDGSDDPKKGSQLIEIYALEIQMNSVTNNHKKLKEIYHKALEVKTAVPTPLTMGSIRECGGKMYMSAKEWDKAHSDFFEAFKNYDEAGNQRRIQCLKYLVLANMLMSGSGQQFINPFDSTEAKPYKNAPEIVAMTNLVTAYEHSDINTFEKVLRENKKTIMDDPFINNYISDLLTNIRTQVLMKLLKGYSRLAVPYISKELNIPNKEVEALLVMLILDNKIRGQIDQVNEILQLDTAKGAAFAKFKSVDKWASQLHSLQSTVVGKVV
jgi:COP9 signalosome complex subunit 2